MSGENNLDLLLKNASPELNAGKYVFCTLAAPSADLKEAAVVLVKEKESVTLVITQELADQQGITYDYVASWITLKIHSSLAAVGLTAAFSRALADQGISCNVIAGFYHDHIFVAFEDTTAALAVLSSLSKAA